MKKGGRREKIERTAHVLEGRPRPAAADPGLPRRPAGLWAKQGEIEGAGRRRDRRACAPIRMLLAFPGEGAAGRERVRRRREKGGKRQKKPRQPRRQKAKGGVEPAGGEAEGFVPGVRPADACAEQAGGAAQENARQPKQHEPENGRHDVLPETAGQPLDRETRCGVGILRNLARETTHGKGRLGGVEGLGLQHPGKLLSFVEDLALRDQHGQQRYFEIPSERHRRRVAKQHEARSHGKTGQQKNDKRAANNPVPFAALLPIQAAVEPVGQARKQRLRVDGPQKGKRKATEKRIDDKRNQQEKQGVGAPAGKGDRHAVSKMGRKAQHRQCRKRPARTGGMKKQPAIFLCGHGGRDPETLAEFIAFVDRLRARNPAAAVGYGFLEFAEPTLAAGLFRLHAEGAQEILALPVTLFEGGHSLADIPNALRAFGQAHPALRLRYGRAFGVEEKLLRLLADRVRAAEAEAKTKAGERENAFLLVVARGAREEGAARDAATIAGRLKAELGFGETLAAFSGLARPTLKEGLERARRSGAPRVVVVPYFLFTGKLVKQLRAEVEAVAAANGDVEWLLASHLFGHPLLEEAACDRIAEIANA